MQRLHSATWAAGGGVPMHADTEEAVRRIRALDRVPEPQTAEAAVKEPPKADVRVSFRPSEEADVEALRKLVGDALPPEAFDELVGIEARLLKWMRKSPEHGASFLVDPVRALEEADAGLSHGTLHALADYRDRMLASISLDELASIGSLALADPRDEKDDEDPDKGKYPIEGQEPVDGGKGKKG